MTNAYVHIRTYVCICMYVCTYVCAYVCEYVHVRTSLHTYVRTYVCLDVGYDNMTYYVHVHNMYERMYVRTCTYLMCLNLECDKTCICTYIVCT